MKGIDFMEALSQIDTELADSYLNGTPAAEQKAASETVSGITVQKTAHSAAEHPRRLKLLSAAGMLGSMAACAALVFGFWKLSAPDPASTEQSSDVSVISLDADSTDESAAAVTTAVIAGKPAVTAAASDKKAAAKTAAAPAQTAANAAQNAASEQKTVTSVKNDSSANSAPAADRTNRSAAQTTAAKPAQQQTVQTTAAQNDHFLTVPNFVGLSLCDVMDLYSNIYMIRVDEGGYSEYEFGTVFEQSIPEGTKIPVNEVIHIKESCGNPPEAPIPDVCGMDLKLAKSEMRKAGYTPMELWSNFTDTPYGTVFRTKQLETGQIVLYTSNGAGGYMPDLVGKKLEEYQNMYYDTVDLVISGYVASNQPDGTILEQSVEPGTAIKRDFDFEAAWHDCTRVYVTLAGSGSMLEPVGSMPDMVGDVISIHGDIPEKLKALALSPTVAIVYTFDTTSDSPTGTVLSQFPATGEAIWESGEIVLVISNPESEYVNLPDLVGKPFSEAVYLIRDAECEPIIGNHVYCPDLPEFTVVETVPGDLSNLRTGSGIRLIVSVSDQRMANLF